MCACYPDAPKESFSQREVQARWTSGPVPKCESVWAAAVYEYARLHEHGCGKTVELQKMAQRYVIGVLEVLMRTGVDANQLVESLDSTNHFRVVWLCL